jgi:hypothetical protein
VSGTQFFTGYFGIAGLYLFFVCVTIIWSLACAGGNYLFWAGVFIALVGYFLAQIGVWYLVCQFCVRNATKCRIILPAVLMTSFVFWMERCSFFLFGCCEGVPLFQPLIFLLDSFIVRNLVFFVGAWSTLFLLHICLLTFFVRRWGVVMRVFFLVVLCGSFFIERVLQPPLWLTRCVVLRPPFVPGVSVDISAHVQSIAHLVAAIAQHKDLVFMPESAVPFVFADYASAYTALCSLSEGHTLFFGTHRRSRLCSRDIFNAVYCLRGGHEFFWHDKTHGMIGLERLPVAFQCGVIMRGLRPLLGDGFFVQAERSDAMGADVCALGEGLVLKPFICSEFFYCYHLDKLDTGIVVVAFVNDAWFAGTAVPYLLWAVARLKALFLRRTVLYISYRYAGLFDIAGNWFCL